MSRPNPRYVPFTVEAELLSAPAVTGPLMLDGILHYAAGCVAGLDAPGGLDGGEDFQARLRLPLFQVRRQGPRGGEWWFAASQATPVGPESRYHLHRRPALHEVTRWTQARSVNIGTGADKGLRVPYFTRPSMLHLRWHGIGDPEAVARLLCWVGAVGRYAGHGLGWVQRWTVRRGGPPTSAYWQDVRLRHLPTWDVQPGLDLVGRTRTVMLPLTPPYHERRRSVAVVQLAEG